ncbi:hypothetical protein K1719_014591 [Acacia pycnantha]|nr:hypothetical protein K1719_014591 [Acacia pycnantha]
MPSHHSTSSSSYITDLSLTEIPISFIYLPSLQVSVFDSVAMNTLKSVLEAQKNLRSSFTILALLTSAPHENLNTRIPYSVTSLHMLLLWLSSFTYLPSITKPLKASKISQRLILWIFLGVIVNTFNFLEARAVEVMKGGFCPPNDQTPPIFCMGPLITSARDHAIASSNSDDEKSNCLAWLDKQPSKSVVFLCFGSKGVFCEAQPKLEELLPDGFLERTQEKGLVVKSRAPQNAILRHESVGGFVTHWLELSVGSSELWSTNGRLAIGRRTEYEQCDFGEGDESGDTNNKKQRRVGGWREECGN